MEKNLTTGSVFGNIVRFSLPYLFSYFLQTLYGMADLFIIGQYADASGTTAVSVGSQVMHMLTLMIVGLAMGATVTIGQAVGARDQKSAARYTGNTMTLFLVLSVAVTGLLAVAIHTAIGDIHLPPAQLRAAIGLEAFGRRDVAHLQIGQNDQRGCGDGQCHHGTGGEFDFILHVRAPGPWWAV